MQTPVAGKDYCPYHGGGEPVTKWRKAKAALSPPDTVPEDWDPDA